MSNLLAIPLVQLTVVTGNNEDWVDSIKFVIGTGSEPDPPQLDIRGIIFEMEVRREADDPEVVLGATTANNTLMVGSPPDVGYLIINIPYDDMRGMRAGPYVADIVGRDDFHTRVIIQIDLTITEGVTKQPVNTRVVVQAAA